jgi:nucleoside-diphosphate-sugar epimerase
MNILITGGCGYVGTVLTETLLNDGHKITVIDTQWFGNHLKEHPDLVNIKGDIRNIESINLEKIDTILHLANIANDPAVELNPTLSWEVNVLAAQQLADKAIRNGVKHFVYASSGSVYGVKDEPQVTEDLSLVPISVYNKTKMVAERVLLSYQDKMQVHCIRPATVCGMSPRMRLDVSVNMLTFQALKNKKITVFGGDQTRPNIHMKDMVRVYQHFVNNSNIESGCYNAGFENISILQIAEMVKNKLGAEIIVSESNDPRSYRQNSDKLLNTGFNQEYGVDYAINEIIDDYNDKKLVESDSCYTVKWMKNLNLVG